MIARLKTSSQNRWCDTPRPATAPRTTGVGSEGNMRDLTAPALLDALTLLVSQAGAEILRIADGALDAREKSDATPVTAADEASEAVLLTGLDRLLPGIDIISEEAAAQATPCKPGDTFILVDPLDGTREILAGRDEYTINVAIIHAGRPVAGVLAAPARALIWRGAQGRPSEFLRLRPGEGPDRAERKTICTRRFARRSSGGAGQPLASGPADRKISRALAAHRKARLRLGAEIRFARARRRRHLSEARTDERMGYRRGRRHPDRRRRLRGDARRRPGALWPSRRRISHSRFHRLGRRRGGT